MAKIGQKLFKKTKTVKMAENDKNAKIAKYLNDFDHF